MSYSLNIPPNTSLCEAVILAAPVYSDPFPGYLAFVAAFIGVYELWFWITLAALWYRSRSDLRLARRGFFLIFMQSWPPIILLIVGPLRDATGRDKWSCDAVL